VPPAGAGLVGGACLALLGKAGMHRSASLSLGFTASLAGPLAHLPAWAGGHAGLDAGISYAGLTIRLFVFGAFWAAAKCAKHSASSTSQKSFYK